MAPRKSCRFYKQTFPEVDDVVMVRVKNVAEMGAYVNLLEYNNKDGMILLSELSRRRIRSINKLIRVGRDECVVVLRVDKDKGYIDLSKRRVSEEERKKCEEKFNKGKAVNSILRHVAEVEDTSLEELYEKTAWKVEEEMGGGPSSAYDIFKLAITDKPEILDGFDLSDKIKATLKLNIQRRLTPQPVKIRSDIEVACYAYEGIDAVKEALKKGLEKSTEELPLKINLIAPPLYVLTTVCLDKEKGINALQEAIEAIKETITTKSGIMNIKMAPKAVSETEDRELQNMMERFERENLEVGGDSDGSDGESES